MTVQCAACEKLQSDYNHFSDAIVHVTSKKYKSSDDAARELKKAEALRDEALERLITHQQSHKKA
jgi:uncharacterized protein YdcH (DUF465 family)